MFNKKYLINDHYLFEPERKSISVQSENRRNIVLGNNESDIFLTLIERRPEVLSKDDLVELVWKDKGSAVYGSSVVQSISTLRKTLNDSTKRPMFIRTVPKKGYQFVGIITDIIENQSVNQRSTYPAGKKYLSLKHRDAAKTLWGATKRLPVFALCVVAILSLNISAYLLYSSKQQMQVSNLIKAGEYMGVPLLSFRQAHEKNLDIDQINSVIESLVKDTTDVEKFITTSSSKGDLIINAIYFNTIKNKTYIINDYFIK